MKTAFQKPEFISSSRFNNNSILYLISFLAICYILLQSMSIIFMVVYPNDTKNVMSKVIVPNIAIIDWQHLVQKPWTLFTYFLGHVSFWNMLSNLIWLFFFGNIVQNLIGYKEIIPLYIINSILAGLVYCAVTFAWPQAASSSFILNAQVGTMSMAIAALTLAPSYKFYLGERFAIPLIVMFIVYLLLSVAAVAQGNLGLLLLLVVSSICGYSYIRFLQNGIRPGKWIYQRFERMESRFTPDETKTALGNSSRRKDAFNNATNNKNDNNTVYIDSLLDKINQKGYNALTEEEKADLFKASREDF